MKEREAVEKVIKRIYTDHLKRTGRLPERDAVREMERKAARAAEDADNRDKRK